MITFLGSKKTHENRQSWRHKFHIKNKFVAELRDVIYKKDSLRFRRNVERIGEIMAYEISKEFHYSTKDIQSPLGIAPDEYAGRSNRVISTIFWCRTSIPPRFPSVSG